MALILVLTKVLKWNLCFWRGNTQGFTMLYNMTCLLQFLHSRSLTLTLIISKHPRFNFFHKNYMSLLIHFNICMSNIKMAHLRHHAQKNIFLHHYTTKMQLVPLKYDMPIVDLNVTLELYWSLEWTLHEQLDNTSWSLCSNKCTGCNFFML